MHNRTEIKTELRDTEWEYTYIDHDREIVRAIVYNTEGSFYFVRVQRDDDFGKCTLIETAGGGVEKGEHHEDAIRRELWEELGINVAIVAKIGVVSDYYNLIHRHNINHYFLCRVTAFGDTQLTKAEMEEFHLSTWKLRYEEAVQQYQSCAVSPLGKLIANRELPVLQKAKEYLDRTENL